MKKGGRQKAPRAARPSIPKKLDIRKPVDRAWAANHKIRIFLDDQEAQFVLAYDIPAAKIVRHKIDPGTGGFEIDRARGVVKTETVKGKIRVEWA
jgi:hypothetical protein